MVDSHILNQHRRSRRRALDRRRATVHLVGERASNSDIHNDKVRRVDRAVPRLRLDGAPQDLPVLLAIEVPADGLVGRVGAVDLDRVRMEVALGRRRRWHRVARQAVGLVAGSASVDAAVHRAVDFVDGVDVFHDVELTSSGPVTFVQQSAFESPHL